MIHYIEILWLLFLHFVGDFILQNHIIATKKSSNNNYLFFHVLMYTLTMLFGLSRTNLSTSNLLTFSLITFTFHFCQDFLTSRWAKYYTNKGNTSAFFKVIGFDQLIHFVQLIGTYTFLKYN